MSAGQRGGECYTLAVNVEMGPVFHSHSSQMPLYSVPPPFIPPFCLPPFPPPINDPFVRVFFAAVGWRASAGPSPKTSRLSWNCFLLQSIICGLSILLSFFFYYLVFFIAIFVSLFFYLTTCPRTYSQSLSSSNISADGFLKFLPSPLCSLHITAVQHFLHQNFSCLYVFRRPLSLRLLNACRDI